MTLSYFNNIVTNIFRCKLFLLSRAKYQLANKMDELLNLIRSPF